MLLHETPLVCTLSQAGRGYGTEVDLWSLGVMLFEFVCGYLPFADDADEPTEAPARKRFAVARNALDLRPQRPDTSEPKCPKVLKESAKSVVVTNPGTTPIIILAVNSDHGLSFAGEETQTMV